MPSALINDALPTVPAYKDYGSVVAVASGTISASAVYLYPSSSGYQSKVGEKAMIWWDANSSTEWLMKIQGSLDGSTGWIDISSELQTGSLTKFLQAVETAPYWRIRLDLTASMSDLTSTNLKCHNKYLLCL